MSYGWIRHMSLVPWRGVLARQTVVEHIEYNDLDWLCFHRRTLPCLTVSSFRDQLHEAGQLSFLSASRGSLPDGQQAWAAVVLDRSHESFTSIAYVPYLSIAVRLTSCLDVGQVCSLDLSPPPLLSRPCTVKVPMYSNCLRAVMMRVTVIQMSIHSVQLPWTGYTVIEDPYMPLGKHCHSTTS